MRLIYLLCTALMAVNLSFADHRKLAHDLRGFDPDATVDVIVQFKNVPATVHHEKLARTGATLKADLHSINADAYSIRAGALDSIADDPEVEFIAPDRLVSATTFNGGTDWGWVTVLGLNSSFASLLYDGTGVGVAVLDSGINAADDLMITEDKRTVVFQHSFVPGDPSTGDAYGHGTHVAGIVAGNGADSSGKQATYQIRGIAPGVQLISLRVLDKNGMSTDSTVISAIQTAIQLKSKYNIRVMNLSLGRPVSTSYVNDPLCRAVKQAWDAGIVVVVAAGNEGRNNSAGTSGYATITAPGNSPYVITVGAMNALGTLQRSDDKITSYSSKGPTLLDHVVKPDLVAPGNRILSLNDPGSYLDAAYPDNRVPKSVYMNNNTVDMNNNNNVDMNNGKAANDYFQLSGTSMAAPMVSGAAALLLQQNPALTPDQVKARLMKTASKNFPASSVATDSNTGISYTSYYDIFTTGAGYLDVAAALNSGDVATASAASPVVSYNQADGNVYLNNITGANAVWGANAAWGTNAVWGTSAVGGTNAVWGTTAVWGNSSVSGFNAVWGTNAAWGAGTAQTEGLAVLLKGEN